MKQIYNPVGSDEILQYDFPILQACSIKKGFDRFCNTKVVPDKTFANGLDNVNDEKSLGTDERFARMIRSQ